MQWASLCTTSDRSSKIFLVQSRQTALIPSIAIKFLTLKILLKIILKNY
jgi:hypothetical protein